jgi:lipopolysaccharide/colanic/teichoic acid biosynthesis glycosyltransferase
MCTKIERHPELLREVVGVLCPGEDAYPGLPSVNQKDAISLQSCHVAELLQSRGVDEIILTVPTPGHPEIIDLTSRCNSIGIAVSMVPQPYELYLTKHELSDLDGVPLLQLLPLTSNDAEPIWKRPFDVCMALALLPVCLIPMLAAAALLRFTKGSAFCTERRLGKNGVQFSIYRLNSPRTGIRLARYERLFQRLSIAELPQLFNVLRGEMSLVGPRPEGLDRARRYTEWNRQRLKVKPGITGLAQVYGLRDQHASEDKTRYDLQYILRRSVFQDISLLLQTAWTLMLRMLRRQNTDLLPETPPEEVPTLFVQETLVHAHSSQSSPD